MVALTMLLDISPATSVVKAAWTAWQKLHTVGTIEVDPQSLVLVWNLVSADNAPSKQTSVHPT